MEFMDIFTSYSNLCTTSAKKTVKGPVVLFALISYLCLKNLVIKNVGAKLG